MSVSMYTSRVNSLSTELARLRGQLADERRKLADANAKAAKAVEALSKATSTSQFASRSREMERQQKAAVAIEKRAADLEKRIAAKQRDLSSAQQSLERATRDQQKKDDREAERRRKADLDHLRQIEMARRRAASFPETFEPHPVGPRGPSPTASLGQGSPLFTETFDVCLSFAGEQRDYVEWIADQLKATGLRVFYDQDEDIAPLLWGRDLAEFLDYVYREGSRFCLMFISADYAEKAWTKHERRSALARALNEDEYVLPARFDDTELPGVRPTIGYLDLRQTAPATLVEFVLKKLGARSDSARSESGS